MMENLRKALLMGVAFNLLNSYAVHAMADDDGADDVLSVIELDENLDEAEKPEELAAGTYVGEVQDVQIQTSSKGNRYFAVKFVIPEEEIPSDIREGFPDGAVLYWNRQVVPKQGDRRALWNLRRFMEALGLPTNKNSIDPNEWMGCRAKLRVKMGKWEGQDRAEIGAVESAEAPASAARGSRGKAQEAAPKAAARGRRR